MREAVETERRKKGFFALLVESITKSTSGCGPGCGCHAEDAKKKAACAEPVPAKDGKKA